MKNVLFVCMGNICRSPAAEAIFNNLLEKNGLSDEFFCDSSGTYGEMAGTPAEKQMVDAAKRRGIAINHKSRHTKQSDFAKFDYIIGMDARNIRALEKIRGNFAGTATVLKMAQFLDGKDTEVPDPYGMRDSAFEYVLDLLTIGCANLLKFLQDK